MAIEDLLAKLEGRAVTSVTGDVTTDVTPKPAQTLACTAVTSVTAGNDDTADRAPSELSDHEFEARRQAVLAMLADRQAVRYAVLADTESDPEAVILAIAIRGAMADGATVTCELRIPREKYDPFLLLDLIARHGTTVH